MALTPFPVNDEEFSVETRDTSPANLLMRIESFSLLSKYEISEYESREFKAGGYKWKIIFYHDGYNESEKEGGENISVSLSASGTNSLPSDWEINVIFSFFLYNQIFDNYLCFRGIPRRFNALNPKWRYPKLMPKKTLMDPSNGYLVDDNCVFGAEIFVNKGRRINECLSLFKEKPPVKRTWKISSFSKLKGVWSSEVFKVGNHNWKVLLFPKGDSRAKGQYISIYAQCVELESFQPHQKLKAEVLMKIKSKLCDTHHSRNFNHWFTHMNKAGWGYIEFISIYDLYDPSKGFLVRDCCILEIQITVQAEVLDAPKI